jgi:hypothetical protein
MENKKLIIFCTSHKTINYLDKFYPAIQMVGCSDTIVFPNSWHKSNEKKNISEKFFSYADLVGHYYIWRNFLDKYNQDSWIGFSQYRRLWIKNKIASDIELNLLDRIILTDLDESWNEYDAIIPPAFFFKKKMKEIIKNFLLFPIKRDISLLKYKITVLDQFAQSLGPFGKDLIFEIVQYLPTSESYDFLEFLKTRTYLSAHGMYISKVKIINQYSNLIFEWFLKCENIINKNNNLLLINNSRIFQYINERFLDYWFSKYYKVLRWPMIMYNLDKNKLTSIGKI